MGITAVNGRLYAVGGFDGKTFLDTIEVYDVETNQWSEYASHLLRSRPRSRSPTPPPSSDEQEITEEETDEQEIAEGPVN